MRARIRSKLTYANVVSSMALFAALGLGTAWAASLPANSVGAAQIKKNAVGVSEIKKDGVSTSEIKTGGVGSSEVKDGTLAAIDVGDGTLTGADIGDRTLGTADLADGAVTLAKQAADSVDGSKVLDGSLTPADLPAGTFLGGKVTVQFEQATAALADGATGMSYDVHCPPGQTAIGGGGRGDATDSEYTVTHSSRPVISTTSGSPPVDNGTFTGWRITVTNPVGDLPQDAGAPGPADGPILPEVWVICSALP